MTKLETITQVRMPHNTAHHHMAAAASDPNTEILQFDWFISGRIFRVSPTQRGKFKKALLASDKN